MLCEQILTYINYVLSGSNLRFRRSNLLLREFGTQCGIIFSSAKHVTLDNIYSCHFKVPTQKQEATVQAGYTTARTTLFLC